MSLLLTVRVFFLSLDMPIGNGNPQPALWTFPPEIEFEWAPGTSAVPSSLVLAAAMLRDKLCNPMLSHSLVGSTDARKKQIVSGVSGARRK